MSTTPEGLILPFEPPVEDTAATTHANIPSGTCYPTGQFVRFMESYGDTTVRDVIEQRDVQPSIESQAMRDIAVETLGTCGRICVNGCRLGEVLQADASPLQVELSMTDDDRARLRTVGTFLDVSLYPTAEVYEDDENQEASDAVPLDRGEQHIKGVLELSFSAGPGFDNDYYRALGGLCNSNFHVMKLLTSSLLRISQTQQEQGRGAALRLHGFTLEDPAHITAIDLYRLLLHPDRDFHFILNLKSTPRSEIFPQA